MAIVKLDVINAALALIGAEKLTSAELTASTEKRADVANMLYDISYKEIFDKPDEWKFARTRRNLTFDDWVTATTYVVGDHVTTNSLYYICLTAHTSGTFATDLAALKWEAWDFEPDFGYEYQYPLPSDCRRVLTMVDEDGDDYEYKWRRESIVQNSKEYNGLLTDEIECRIRYQRILTDPDKWPAWFLKLVYINLAILMSEPMKGTDFRAPKNLMALFDEAYEDAQASNEKEDADTNDDGTNKDKGNNDVLNATTSDPSYRTNPRIIER